jgi:hypothetical protein
MLSYLRCIKSHRGTNDSECRNLSKSYLSCRMDRYVPDLPSLPHSLNLAMSIFFSSRRLRSFQKQGRKEELVIPTCQNSRTRSLGLSGCGEARER